MDIAAQAAEVRRVKKFRSGYGEPYHCKPETTVRELIAITLYNIEWCTCC